MTGTPGNFDPPPAFIPPPQGPPPQGPPPQGNFDPPPEFIPPPQGPPPQGPPPPGEFAPPPPGEFAPPPPGEFAPPPPGDFGSGSPGYIPPGRGAEEPPGPSAEDIAERDAFEAAAAEAGMAPEDYSDTPEGRARAEEMGRRAEERARARGEYFPPEPSFADGTQASQDQIDGWQRGADGSLMPPADWAVDGQGGYVYSPPEGFEGEGQGAIADGTQASQDQIDGWQRGADGSLMPPADWAADGQGGYVYSPPSFGSVIDVGGPGPYRGGEAIEAEEAKRRRDETLRSLNQLAWDPLTGTGVADGGGFDPLSGEYYNPPNSEGDDGQGMARPAIGAKAPEHVIASFTRDINGNIEVPADWKWDGLGGFTYAPPEWEVDLEGNYRYLGPDELANSVPSALIPESDIVLAGTLATEAQVTGWSRGADGNVVIPPNWADDGNGGYVYSPPTSTVNGIDVNDFQVSDIANLKYEEIQGLNRNHFAAFDPQAMTGFGSDQIENFDPLAIGGLSEHHFAAFDPTAIAGFKSKHVAAFDPMAVAGFDDRHIAAFDTEAIAGFNADHVAALEAKAIAGLDKDQFAAFDPSAMAGFNSDHFAAIDYGYMTTLGMEHVAAFDPMAVASFDDKYISAFAPTAVAGFRKDHLAAFDSAAMQGFMPTHVAALDPEAMAGFRGNQLKELDPESFAALTPEQAANMAPDAAAAFKNWVLPDDDIIRWEGGLRGPDGSWMSAESFFNKRTSGDQPAISTVWTPPEADVIAKTGGFTKADGTFVEEDDYFKDPLSAGWTVPPDELIKKDGGFRNPNGKWVTAKDFLNNTGIVPEKDVIKRNGGYFDVDNTWVSSIAHFGEGSADAQTVAWAPPPAKDIKIDGGFWDPFGQWVKAESFQTEGWKVPEAEIKPVIPEGITANEIKLAGGYRSTSGAWVTDASFFDTSLDNEANKIAGYWGATKDPIKEAATAVELAEEELDPTALDLDKKPIGEVAYPWMDIKELRDPTSTESSDSISHWASLVKSKDDGDDRLEGGETSDKLFGGLGSDFIDGGEGKDVAFYAGNFEDYHFDRTKDTISIKDQREGLNDGNDTLKNIEYIQFADQKVDVSKLDVVKTYTGKSKDFKFYKRDDGTIEVKTDDGFDDITGVPKLEFDDKSFSGIRDIQETFDQVKSKDDATGQMFRVYNAAFARFPDAGGLEYWIEKNASGENSNRQVADSFLASDEFKSTYGENVDTGTYVNTLYKNILGREADQAGYDYWVEQLDSGLENRGELLLGFAESVENQALFSEVTGLF
ncbi:DUF4214 domain-containing protein [Prochlorococcus marinus]|uniref:DUF4214 domain-containing protein n=1 Tax=Prochlorococcus marinus TaxID=1219 RepID=UPI0022B538D7|nr:DUF4214 domain-containing protein [Prochlorococcus marinus]